MSEQKIIKDTAAAKAAVDPPAMTTSHFTTSVSPFIICNAKINNNNKDEMTLPIFIIDE